jgi:hypothetical protein
MSQAPPLPPLPPAEGEQLAVQPLPPGDGEVVAVVQLPRGQRELLRQALADAVSYRDPPLTCRACDVLDGLCGQWAAGLARARAYLALGGALGMEAS